MKTTLRIPTLIALLVAPLFLCACDDKAPSTPVTPETPSTALGKTVKMAKDVKSGIEAQSDQAAAAAGAISGEKGNLVVGNLTFNVPADKFEKLPTKETPFAAVAEYKVTGPDGDAQLKFFNAGGDVQANIARWRGQMGNPNVQPTNMSVGTLKITKIVMSGTYIGMGPTGGAAPSQEGTRFLGAIIELPGGGQIQVRMTGPERTVETVEAQWNAIVAGVQLK